jgi:hypothetical protein
VFIANKVDLESPFDYDSSMAEIAKKYNAPTFKTSAKTGANIEGAFLSLGKMVLATKEKPA